MDLGSVTISGQWILDKPGCEELLVKLSFQSSASERAQARKLWGVGGWARRAQAGKKIKKKLLIWEFVLFIIKNKKERIK